MYEYDELSFLTYLSFNMIQLVKYNMVMQQIQKLCFSSSLTSFHVMILFYVYVVSAIFD